MNELLWIGMMLANFGCVMLLYRLWGREGLLYWIPLSVVLANVQVVKLVELFGVTATLGNIVYATSFLVTDILSENHGRGPAQQAGWIGFFSLIAMTGIMNLALVFVPSQADTAQPALETIFKVMPRIALASLAAYGISQFHDVWAYHWIRKHTAERMLWLRNNGSTMVSQLIDSVVFSFLAFWGTVPTDVFWQIVISTYLFKFIVALCDTPFLYLARHLYRTGRAGLFSA